MVKLKNRLKFPLAFYSLTALVGLTSLIPTPLLAAESPPVISFDGATGQGSSTSRNSSASDSGARKVQLHLDGGIAETAEERVSPLIGMAFGVTLNDYLAIDFDIRYRTHFGESSQNNSFNYVSLSPILRSNYELWDGFSLHNVFGIGVGITTMKLDRPNTQTAVSGSDSETKVKAVWTLGVGVEQAVSENMGIAFDLRFNHLDYRKGYLYILPDSVDVTVGASFNF
ncbi:MAG: outer membrane beta-barrel protein [Candidatus Pacebacteria bacterium]|nr:outer membrane beta-barrel protein [Candidatus Paceibacterota bacterium]